MLSDPKTYRVLDEDPTSRYKKQLVKILTRLKKEKKITEAQYKYLYPTSEAVPRLYCTPKIHKEGTPLRPIVDYTGSISYNLSKSLSELLSPLVGNTEHHVLNSKEFTKEMRDVRLDEDEVLNSHDVVSLFTNVPIPETMDIIKDRLVGDNKLHERTLLEVSDIVELLKFCMSTTYFLFRGVIYEQVYGTAMGSPVSVVIANLFMEWFEQTALRTAPDDIKPRLWRRFVDDIWEVIKAGKEPQLTAHLNQVDPTGSIQVTSEPETVNETDSTLPFLDSLSHHHPDGKLTFSVYRKKTHTDQYLSFNSNHPLNHKLGVVRTLMDRCDAIVSTPEDRATEQEHIRKALKMNGYPEWAFKKVEQQRSMPKSKDARNQAQQKSKGTVSIPYVPRTSEACARVMKKYGINTVMKPTNTLRQALVKPKDKRPLEDSIGVVYNIPCHQCPKAYIGETGRKLGVRINEHKDNADKASAQAHYTRSQKKMSKEVTHKSALADHCKQDNHVIDWDNTTVMAREQERLPRWIRESVHIRRQGRHALNRDEGQYPLPHTWDHALKHTGKLCVTSHATDAKAKSHQFDNASCTERR